LDYEQGLLKLQQELENRTYLPGRSICFVVTNPKIREIFAADFRDRIVHHLLVEYLEPIFESKFIFHSFACRKGKGAHKAIEYLHKAICTPSYQNLSFGDSRSLDSRTSGNRLYYLQIDIQAFFMSLDKSILFAILKKHIKNPEILWLAKTIIFHKPTNNFRKKGQLSLFDLVPNNKSLFTVSSAKGLPIGNLTSQFFANVYLNELDQFAKHTLKIKHYFRYVDDIVILHHNQKKLKFWRKQIDGFLKKRLKLKLHPKKDISQPTTQGINFLGYINKPDCTLVRNRTVRSLKSKLWHFNQKILSSHPNQPLRLWTPELCEQFNQIRSVINSYYGLFKHANTFRLRKHLYEKHFNVLELYLEPDSNDFNYFRWIDES